MQSGWFIKVVEKIGPVILITVTASCPVQFIWGPFNQCLRSPGMLDNKHVTARDHAAVNS